LISSAASCDKRPTYAEFEARTWPTACSADQDCVLLPVPCDHCGAERSIAASEGAAYQELAATVSCDDYTLDDDCGDSLDMEPACVRGHCTARFPAEPTTEAPPPSSCETLRARAATLLSTPAAACESDDECGCYPAFIDCGGVRDATSAATLAEIAEAGSAASCGYVNAEGSTFNCAPWECVPTCEAGACQRAH